MTTYHTVWSSDIGHEGLIWIERADTMTFDGEYRWHHFDADGKYASSPLSREEFGEWVAMQAKQWKELFAEQEEASASMDEVLSKLKSKTHKK